MAEAAKNDDDTTIDDDKSIDGNKDDSDKLPDYLEEVIIQGLDDDEEDTIITPDKNDSTDKDDKDVKTSKDKKASTSKGDKDTAEDSKTLRIELDTVKGKNLNLQKALHEQRQKFKGFKKDADKGDDAPLTKPQLKQIYEENKDDPDTLFRVIEHMAEQVAKKASGKAVLDSDIKRKVKDASGILNTMYPKLFEEGSDVRLATDETKAFYNIDDHPLGDFFAVGVQVLNALPNLISSAEKRGKEEALGEKADKTRKKDIKDNQTSHSKKKGVSTKGLSKTAIETATQMNLSPGALRTYNKIMGKQQPKTVQVKE